LTRYTNVTSQNECDKFTFKGILEAEEEVKAVLNRIVCEILRLLGNRIDAIAVVGSFGRGEGSIVEAEGRWRLVNDVDIVVVQFRGYLETKRKLMTELHAICEEIARRFDIKQIDISVTHPFRLRTAPKLVSFYEMREGHRILWGSKTSLLKIPKIKEEQLQVIDGTILFANRGSGLIISALYLECEKLSEREKENFNLEINKAIIAVGDSILLMNGEYNFSYAERAKRLKEISVSDVPSGEWWKERYKRAIARKLSPSTVWEGMERARQKFEEVVGHFSEFYLWFEGKRLSCEFNGWLDYNEHQGKTKRVNELIGTIRTKISEIGHKKRGAQQKPTLGFKLNFMPLVLFSWGRTRERKLWVSKAIEGMSTKMLHSSFHKDMWKFAAIEYLRIFHPNGVVSELLGKFSNEL